MHRTRKRVHRDLAISKVGHREKRQNQTGFDWGLVNPEYYTQQNTLGYITLTSRVVVFTTRYIFHSRVLEPSTPKCYLPGELFLGLLENTHTRGQAEDRKHVVYHRFCQTFKDCFPAETLSANTAEHHVKNVCVHSCVCEHWTVCTSCTFLKLHKQTPSVCTQTNL